jgi:RNA polymerase sigma-70 factor (ECF subfamily)
VRWLENICNFAAPSGVLGSNDETPVQNPPSGLIPPADFTTFMRAYQDMVFSTAARITGNETQAEDISQEVFLKAHAHFDNLRTSPTAGGWLKTVATNLSLNHLSRYRNRWKFFSELKRDDAAGDAPEVEFAAPDTFFSGVDAGERREWVERALEDLPQHQRVPLVLYHFEDMPYDEIAKKLGVSLAKVKTDILRARTALAKILQRGGTAHETLET